MLHEPIVAAETRRITVMQGQARASATPGDVFTTVLGSCIACCLFDPVLGIGGMNHFLLAEPAGKGGKHRVDEHYGAYLMELLINEMLALGAMKSRMKAHLYGGANMHAGMTKIGTANAEFAQRFLDQERIVIAHANMGGSDARRVDFMPALGRARCRTVAAAAAPPVLPPAPRAPRVTGDVELF